MESNALTRRSWSSAAWSAACAAMIAAAITAPSITGQPASYVGGAKRCTATLSDAVDCSKDPSAPGNCMDTYNYCDYEDPTLYSECANDRTGCGGPCYTQPDTLGTREGC